MNKLHPVIKNLISVADKADRSLETSAESVPSRNLVLRVLRESARPTDVPAPSLLESMVQRCAAVAAVIGLLALTVQLTAGGPFPGISSHALTQSVVLLRVFVP